MNEKKAYAVANQYCKNEGARLFEPKSETANKAVYDKAVEVFGGNPEIKTWIGINDIATEGKWVFESSGIEVSSAFWHKRNQVIGEQDCVIFGYFSDNWENWLDRKCDEKNYFICEYGEYKYF